MKKRKPLLSAWSLQTDTQLCARATRTQKVKGNILDYATTSTHLIKGIPQVFLYHREF